MDLKSRTFMLFSSCLLSLSKSVWMADQSLMCILFCADHQMTSRRRLGPRMQSLFAAAHWLRCGE